MLDRPVRRGCRTQSPAAALQRELIVMQWVSGLGIVEHEPELQFESALQFERIKRLVQ